MPFPSSILHASIGQPCHSSSSLLPPEPFPTEMRRRVRRKVTGCTVPGWAAAAGRVGSSVPAQPPPPRQFYTAGRRPQTAEWHHTVQYLPGLKDSPKQTIRNCSWDMAVALQQRMALFRHKNTWIHCGLHRCKTSHDRYASIKQASIGNRTV